MTTGGVRWSRSGRSGRDAGETFVNGTGRSRLRSRGRAAAALAVVTVALAACGGGDAGDDAIAATPSTLPPCSEERHVVAFDFFGTISLADADVAAWVGEEATPPPARPGVPDVAAAYRARGYEILYITTVPAGVTAGGVPIGDAVTGWLTENGFPTGPGTAVWVWDGNYTPMEGIANELERLAAEGATVDAAYTDNEDKAFAFKTAVPSEEVHTLGTGAAATGTAPVPGDDMVTHAAEVAQRPAACRAA
jgi:hypothetical protein